MSSTMEIFELAVFFLRSIKAFGFIEIAIGLTAVFAVALVVRRLTNAADPSDD